MGIVFWISPRSLLKKSRRSLRKGIAFPLPLRSFNNYTLASHSIFISDLPEVGQILSFYVSYILQQPRTFANNTKTARSSGACCQAGPARLALNRASRTSSAIQKSGICLCGVWKKTLSAISPMPGVSAIS